MDLRRLLLTLRHQAWLLLGLTLSLLALFLLLPQLGKKVVYTSTAKILLTPSQRGTGFNDAPRPAVDSGNWIADLQTLTELVTSERLLSRVGTVLSLSYPWQDLRERVVLEPISQDYSRKVSLFAITVEDTSPQQAQKLTNAVVQEFVSYVEDLSAREFANTRRFLEELVAEAKEKVDDTEEKLLSITSSHADASESSVTLESINLLESDRRKLREEQAVLEAEVGAVQSYLSGSTSVVPSSILSKGENGLGQLESSVTAARIKMLELEQLYTNENQQVLEQRSKLEKLSQLYDTRVQQHADAISQEKNKLLADKQKQIAGIDARISEIRNRQLSPAEKRQAAKLERQLAMWEDNHLNLVKQLYQARVVEQASRRQGAITVLETPGLGVESKNKRGRSLGALVALGLPFSFGAAVVIILALDFLGATLRLAPQIESTLGLPILSIIPPVDAELGALWESYKREETVPKKYSALITDQPPERASLQT